MSKQSAPKNLGELADFCGVVSADLYNRVMEPKLAKEITNSNGKFINACKAFVEACHQRGTKAEAPQLEMK